MKKVLVSGATGFVGKYVVEELLHRGHKVIATSSDIKNARHQPWFETVEYKPLNLRSFDRGADYYDYFLKPDLMIHLAWEGLPNYKADFHISENLPSHIDFLSNMIDNGLRDLTVAGTCLEYGKMEGNLLEESICRPIIPYAIAKNLLREFLEKTTLEKEVNFKWVRLFYIHGEGQGKHSLLSQLKEAILKNDPVFNMSGGEQMRDYLPIESVAKYICGISLQNKTQGIINCSSAKPVKISNLVEEFVRANKSDIKLNKGFYPYPDYEPMTFWGDNTKLNKAIT